MDVFKDIFNWLGGALNDVLGWVLFVLPDSPFKFLKTEILEPYLPYIGYFINFPYIMTVSSAWIAAVGVFYGYKLILAWIKAIN